jgi:hypothetical protein
MAKFFRFPFALTGDRTAVPDATQPDGTVSYNEGYGQDYSRPRVSDPLAKNIERIKMNQLFYDLTNSVRQYQTVGFPEFITSSDNGGTPFPYEKGATVRWNNGTTIETYLSLVDNNTELPSNAANWVIVTGLIQAAQIGANQVTFAKIQQLAANTILANPTNATADAQAMSVPASTFFGRLATGDAVFMSVAQAKTLLAITPADVAGLASGSNSNQYSLHADGSGGIGYRNDWLGDVLLANSTDFNSVIDPGRYRFLGANTHANRPFTTNDGFVDVYRNNGTTVTQLAWSYSSTGDAPTLWKRVSTNSGSSWSAWFNPLTAPQSWTGPQRSTPLSVAYAASLTLDLATANNFNIGTLTGNITLNNPSNQVAGQSGAIKFLQDGTGGRTITYGTNWKFIGGNKTTLSVTGGALDTLYYYVQASGDILCFLGRDYG